MSKPLELSHPKLTEKERSTKKAKASKILSDAKKLLIDMDEKERIKKKSKASKTLSDAEKLLIDTNSDENMTLEEFYIAISTTENEYVEALQISERGKVLILKREINERNINNYNPEMILAWNANMDIQMVVDPYAVISYIASYMNKDDTQTTPFLREALHAAAGKEAKEKLRALKEAYISHRQVGGSEAAYKVNPSLRMKVSNITCIFVVSGFPKNRSLFYRRVKDDDEDADGNELGEEEMEDDEEDEEFEDIQPPEAKRVKIEGRPGTYTVSISVIDRYVARPQHLDDMCLGQFAICYIYAPKVPKRIIFNDDGCSTEFSEKKIFEEEVTEEDRFLYDTVVAFEEESFSSEIMDTETEGEAQQDLHHLLPNYISLKDGLGMMRLRAHPAVMRIHTSKKKVDYEQQYSELLLFTNWRNEEDEFHPDNGKNCIRVYNERLELIKRNKESIYPGEGTIDLLENMDLDLQRPSHIYDMLDGERQQQEEDDLVVGAENDPQFESFAYTGNLAQGENAHSESFKYRIVKVPKDDELRHRTLRLVPEQMNILRKVCHYCRDVVKSKKKHGHKVKPLRLIIHGGAGKNFSLVVMKST
jgi:hypothetical protein